MDYRNVAVLIHLRAEMPQMTKKDDRAVEAVDATFGSNRSGTYRKDLYPKEYVEPITTQIATARQFLRKNTRPHYLTGKDVLPNKRIFHVLEEMGKFEVGFWQLVTAFLNNISNVMQQAQRDQGGLFDPTEYPDLSALKSQFVFEYPISPIGTYNDFVLDELDADAQSVLIRKVQEDSRVAMESDVRGALSDLRTQVLRIAKQTNVTTTTNKKGEVVERSGKIYDTLTSDIANLVDMLAALRFGGNEVLRDIALEIDTHLTLPADTLRNDLEVCKITKAKADSILAKMEAFL